MGAGSGEGGVGVPRKEEWSKQSIEAGRHRPSSGNVSSLSGHLQVLAHTGWKSRLEPRLVARW